MGHYFDSNSLDHRIIFVAACSTFVTLFILSLFNKCHYIKHKDELNQELESQQNNDMQEEKQETIKVSESSLSLLCKDIITEDFYIQQKTKNYYQSDTYLNSIPSNPNWTKRKIKLLINDPDNYSEQLHDILLDHFDPLSIEPQSNICINELCNGIKLFNKWRKWKHGNDDVNGWQYRTTTKDQTYVYTHSLANSQLDVVKAEQIFPFNVSIILGVFLNNTHFKTMDPSIKSLKLISTTSLTSHIIHICVKCPPFVTDRDFLNTCGIYMLKDGSCLIESVTCHNQDIVGETQGFVRGLITLSMYHIRPHYDGNIQHSKVTFYSHVDIKGSIPSWILNSCYMETANSVPNLCKYIQSLYTRNIIHQPGQLWIPPDPFMKMLGIDIN